MATWVSSMDPRCRELPPSIEGINKYWRSCRCPVALGHVGRLYPAPELDGECPASVCWADRQWVGRIPANAIAVCAGIVAHGIAVYAGDVCLGALRAGQSGVGQVHKVVYRPVGRARDR